MASQQTCCTGQRLQLLLNWSRFHAPGQHPALPSCTCQALVRPQAHVVASCPSSGLGHHRVSGPHRELDLCPGWSQQLAPGNSLRPRCKPVADNSCRPGADIMCRHVADIMCPGPGCCGAPGSASVKHPAIVEWPRCGARSASVTLPLVRLQAQVTAASPSSGLNSWLQAFVAASLQTCRRHRVQIRRRHCVRTRAGLIDRQMWIDRCG